MPACGYKNIFLKDLAAIPKRHRSRIERLVFDEIPASENIFSDFDDDNTIIFYRVKSREEIYRVFP